jgi:uncharacterized membrane protein
VSFDDWMLALHVLSAFAYVAGMILFWILIVAVRRTDTPEATIRMAPAVKVGNAAVGIGAGGTIILGIWLAFSIGGYEIWDGWIIAAIVLLIATGGVGQRTGAYYMDVQKLAEEPGGGNEAEVLARLRAPTGAMLHFATVALFVLIVLDMIYKPGA